MIEDISAQLKERAKQIFNQCKVEVDINSITTRKILDLAENQPWAYVDEYFFQEGIVRCIIGECHDDKESLEMSFFKWKTKDLALRLENHSHRSSMDQLATSIAVFAEECSRYNEDNSVNCKIIENSLIMCWDTLS